MTDSTTPPEAEVLTELRARAEALEQQLSRVQREADSRLIRAELKAEAVRAGMVDLDGLKLLDLSAARLNERGEVEGATTMMTELRREKPWLFGSPSSSSSATPPPAQAPHQKNASEMTDTEYRAARAELLKRRF